jgi:putative phage-type endonuclease
MERFANAVVLADAASMTDGDWRALRQKSVGSSDAAAVMGRGKYGSPHQVWLSKVSEEGPRQSFVMALGHKMEPIILELAAEELGMTISKPDLVLQHPEHPTMTCNIDGFATNPYGEEAIVEAKHAGVYLKNHLRQWKDTGTPEPGSPVEAWWVQVQCQMSITGLDQGHLAALCDKEFFLIGVAKDEAFIARLERDIPRWWSEHVVPNVSPLLHRNDADLVAAANPEGDPDAEPADLGAMADEFAKIGDLKAQIKELKDALKTYEVRAKDGLGTATLGLINGERVINSYETTRKSVDYVSFQAEHPDVFAQVVTFKTSRTYRFF